jgi:rubredoxin
MNMSQMDERQPVDDDTPPDVPIDVACPACGGRAHVQIKYNKEINDFMDFMGTQPEMSSFAGSYTFKGTQICSCERLLRVSLSVTARDLKKAKDSKA